MTPEEEIERWKAVARTWEETARIWSGTAIVLFVLLAVFCLLQVFRWN